MRANNFSKMALDTGFLPTLMFDNGQGMRNIKNSWLKWMGIPLNTITEMPMKMCML